VRFAEDGGPFGSANLLSLIPLQGAPLGPLTRYAAVVLRDVRDAKGARIGVPASLRQIIAGDAPKGMSASAFDSQRAALATLADLGVDRRRSLRSRRKKCSTTSAADSHQRRRRSVEAVRQGVVAEHAGGAVAAVVLRRASALPRLSSRTRGRGRGQLLPGRCGHGLQGVDPRASRAHAGQSREPRADRDLRRVACGQLHRRPRERGGARAAVRNGEYVRPRRIRLSQPRRAERRSR
jgi:hypothetical protein